MSETKSAVCSSDESEEECSKQKKHHRHDRFKVERKVSRDQRETEKYTEHVHKVHKHKKHKKKHKRKRSVEIDSSDESAPKLKKSAYRLQPDRPKNMLSFVSSAVTTSGNLQATSTITSEVETKLCDDLKVEANQNMYGPPLPPDLKSSGDHIFLPPLPPKLKYKLAVKGNIHYPAFPPKLEPQNIKSKSVDFGPALPPKLVPSNENTELSHKDSVFGPALPPKLMLHAEETELSEPEDFVGPIPEGFVDSSESVNLIQHQLASRANVLKMKLLKESEKSESDVQKRESWMVELPAEHSGIIGLGPRKFKRREGPDMSDRSVWTDTPETKRKKEMEEKTEDERIYTKIKSEVVKARDIAMEQQLAGSSSGHKVKSLLEMHQEKQKKKAKKKKKNNPKPERRPFDRNTDLQVTSIDDAQRKVIYKKAQMLNSRFSSGESKFL